MLRYTDPKGEEENVLCSVRTNSIIYMTHPNPLRHAQHVECALCVGLYGFYWIILCNIGRERVRKRDRER